MDHLLGDRVKQFRQSRGLSQGQLAYLSGLSRNHIWQIEHGRRQKIGADVAVRIAGVLEVTVEDLLGETLPEPELLAPEIADLVSRLNALDPGDRAEMAGVIGAILDLVEVSESDNTREDRLARLLGSLPEDRAAYWEALIQAEADAIDRAGSQPAGSPGVRQEAG